MIGGFLGAGKTTAVALLAQRLTDAGLRVGLITNDQSSGLVDTSILRNKGFAVEEIAGGCFCCRFTSLSEAAEQLTESARPDVFVAEPVGSCTDLVATVSYPLRRIYGDRFRIAPLSVMVDPDRALRILGLGQGRSFSEKVVYVYEKQLEEADLIVVNKCDRLDAEKREALVARLEERFPRAEVLTCSALGGDGVDAWFDRLLAQESGEERDPMALDYALYAEGEALLGWFNATARVRGRETFDANALLLELAEYLRAELVRAGVEIAHLKATLDSEEAGGQLAALSLTTSDGPIDQREAMIDGVRTGELILNVRAEVDPELLSTVSLTALKRAETLHAGLTVELEHEEHFRPAPPRPTHRVPAAGARMLNEVAP
jgi:G3E family GTPase